AVQFLVDATAAGLVDARDEIRSAVDAFVSAGGFFGSTNTDTEDPKENVSYAIAFETLLAAGELLDDQATVDAAYELCLRPLTRFELVRDLNGQRTKGLLFMEDAWNAACTWETAQVSHAYLVAYGDTGHRPYVLKALTILRAMALHHHGPFGFLTEAVDWDGHSPTLRHFPGERYGDIATTHPFLNNLQVVLPTVAFLERFARAVKVDDGEFLFDVEGNRLCSMPPPAADWMTP
ncbi:MAG TPA: hypothetical protein VLK34_08625, partial [Nocardioidaceae bacterium]|nr:hypothetical protein [Nocardioidaceae bacterium]